MLYVWEEEESIAVYYSMLRRFANVYTIPTWKVENVIYWCFSEPIEVPRHIYSPAVFNLEVVLNISHHELDKAIRRWYNKFDSLRLLIKQREKIGDSNGREFE